MSRGDIDDFLKALFKREAGTNTRVINYAGYVGKYQFGESALIDLGYYRADGSSKNDWSGKWTGKHGVDSLQAFRDSEAAQDRAAKEWVALLCKRMKQFKLDKYIGSTIKGVRITESGIIAGAHLKGFGSAKYPGVSQFLRSNGEQDPKDGLGTAVSHYVELLGGYDLGCCGHLNVVFAEKETRAPIADLAVQVKRNGVPHKTTKTDSKGTISGIHGFSIGDQYEIWVARLTGGWKLLRSGEIRDAIHTVACLSPKAKACAMTEVHKEKPAAPANGAGRPAASGAAKPVHGSAPAGKPAAASAPARAQAAPAPTPASPAPASPVAAAPAASSGANPAAAEREMSIAAVTPGEIDQLDFNSALWESLAHIDFTEGQAAADTRAVQAPDHAPVPEKQAGDLAAPPAPAALAPAPAPAPASKPAAVSTVKVEAARSASGHPKAVATKQAPAAPAPAQSAAGKVISGLLFPLAKRPKESYKEGGRQFGANRPKGRKHAGIDLYAPVGTEVRAMADGKVVNVYEFYLGTWVVEIDHGSFIARYGEVKPDVPVMEGDEVKRGEPVGRVGKLKGLNFSMLHLELFSSTKNPKIEGLTKRGVKPYQRRSDLIDPTQSIDIAVME